MKTFKEPTHFFNLNTRRTTSGEQLIFFNLNYGFRENGANPDKFKYVPMRISTSYKIKKEHWDEIGGNDPLFAPASWDDMDLFLRMLQSGFRFILPTTSLIWHFGARGSHRLEENNNQSSERQMRAEYNNSQKWLSKWGGHPVFDEYGMIKGIKK